MNATNSSTEFKVSVPFIYTCATNYVRGVYELDKLRTKIYSNSHTFNHLLETYYSSIRTWVSIKALLISIMDVARSLITLIVGKIPVIMQINE